jgi:hypothetical protein
MIGRGTFPVAVVIGWPSNRSHSTSPFPVKNVVSRKTSKRPRICDSAAVWAISVSSRLVQSTQVMALSWQ